MTLPDLSAGNCHNDPDPEMWHRDNLSRKDADDLCRGCPVRSACLAYAIENPAETRYGIWGGMTEQDRMNLRRRTKGQAPKPIVAEMKCKRLLHDLTLPGATYTQRNGDKTWETCAQCKKDRERERAQRIRLGRK